MKKTIFLSCCFLMGYGITAQNHWSFDIGLQNHFQFNKNSTKNIAPPNGTGNMPRLNFSATEGAALALEAKRSSDSSSFNWLIGVQNIWGTLVPSGAAIDVNNQQTELVQSNQFNLKLGLGYTNKGKLKYAFHVGPIIPLANRSKTSVYFKDKMDEYTAFYDLTFSQPIGFWAAADYKLNISTKLDCFFGVGTQLMNKNIKTRKLQDFQVRNGGITSDTYAPNTYSKEYSFLKENKIGINDETLNPGNVDYNKPRELISQAYSFSSVFIQFGVRFKI